ncbi:MAG: GGDEF domain-containing protein [Thermodesulfovibrionia bacterium]|nr:GGDEF domain-containing protein [Thermodesulfovibrionia bacterium]
MILKNTGFPIKTSGMTNKDFCKSLKYVEKKDDEPATRNPKLETRNMKEIIQNLNKRTPLTIKMSVVIVILGVLAWIAFDYMQSRAFKNIFQAQLFEKLTHQAIEDRISFNQHIRKHHQLVALFFTQKNFSNYVEEQMWLQDDAIQVKYHRRPPAWFPPASIQRAFIQPHCVLLLDAQSRVREVYSRSGTLSPSLLQPSSLLLAKSRGQSFLVNIDDAPYVVASDPYADSQGRLRATLMVASPINDEFLIAAVDSSDPGHIVALVAPEEDPQVLKVVTSSNLQEVPAGSSIESLKSRYLVTGEEFFDYGASDIYIRLVSFISAEEVDLLTKSIISSQQKQRIYAAPVFIIAFGLLMFWITRRIERLTRYIIEFSQNKLGVKQEGLEKGDQLYVLESRFHRLTEDVLESREALIREAERRLVLEKERIEMLEKERQLSLLHSVTEIVGVGVMLKSNGGLQAANKPMENFAEVCGGLSVFDIKDAQSLELNLLDKKGNKHVFDVSSPKILKEKKIFLVQDVTKIKAHTEALEYMAVHDALTGLPNRILLYDRLNQAILAGQRERKPFALLMIDVDRFKDINDTLGHHAGDIVLKQVGARLESVIRQADTIARIGGDEFAILLSVPDIEVAKEMTHRLLSTMKQPIIIDGNNLYVKISVGIALYPVHGEDTDALMKRSDVAMYVAKRGQSGFSVYNGY